MKGLVQSVRFIVFSIIDSLLAWHRSGLSNFLSELHNLATSIDSSSQVVWQAVSIWVHSSRGRGEGSKKSHGGLCNNPGTSYRI